jgi:hypothetical protein
MVDTGTSMHFQQSTVLTNFNPQTMLNEEPKLILPVISEEKVIFKIQKMEKMGIEMRSKKIAELELSLMMNSPGFTAEQIAGLRLHFQDLEQETSRIGTNSRS